MTKHLTSFLTFYKRYKFPILFGLLILIGLELCQRQTQTRIQSSTQQEVVQTIQVPVGEPSQDDSNNSFWYAYLIMVGLVLLVYLGQRWGWIGKFMPRLIILKCKPIKINGRLMLRIVFINTKKESYNFDAPIVEFSKWGEKRAFKISSQAVQASFPIMLTPLTSHAITIDLTKFYESKAELRAFGWIRVSMIVDGKKTIKSYPKPIWWWHRK